jgi:hypothetical protein
MLRSKLEELNAKTIQEGRTRTEEERRNVGGRAGGERKDWGEGRWHTERAIHVATVEGI